MLTEDTVESMFRQILSTAETDPDAYDRAEQLLAEELDPNSRLRIRLTMELDAARFGENFEDLELMAFKHHQASWDDEDSDIHQNIGVEIHIRDANPRRDTKPIERVQNAVAEFLLQFGFSPDPENQPKEVHASWHWYEWFRSKLPFARKETEQIYEDMKEALRRRHIDQTGADAFNSRATAAAELIKSIEPFPDVVIRLGDIVVVKATIDGVAKLGIETLSPELARRLDSRPYAMTSSESFYQFINEEKSQALVAGTTTTAPPTLPSDKAK